MANDQVFDIDNLPDDVEVYTQKPEEFKPLDTGEIYQVYVDKVELKLNNFYKPEEEDPKKRGNKYQLNIEMTVLNDGEYLGRKIWDNTSLSLKPDGKKGPSKLFKIVSRCLGTEMDWDECAAFAPDAKTLLRNLNEVCVGKQLRVSIENKQSSTGKIHSRPVVYSMIRKEMPLPNYDDAPHPAETAK